MKHIHYFEQDISGIEIPSEFTFPFNYTPHPLSVLATELLQDYLKNQTELQHNFNNDNDLDIRATGKMFGVLVVKDKEGKLGFLAAFSGKVGNENNHPYFVPPVYDLLSAESFFVKEYEEIFHINEIIRSLEQHQPWLKSKAIYEDLLNEATASIEAKRTVMKIGKSRRKTLRNDAINTLSNQEYLILCEDFAKESEVERWGFKHERKKWDEIISSAKKQYDLDLVQIETLKAERIELSQQLQTKIFKNYYFLNKLGSTKNLNDIFCLDEIIIPPAGAGECAAPKLLQYAYNHQLHPICMAEFWWGQSPKSEIRKHLHFYPSCKGKCAPILAHMLEGLHVEENPLKSILEKQKNDAANLEILYEDAFMLAVNKPAELLSVPGKLVTDSVQERIQRKYPEFSGPLMVHRLDMSTSGILLIAKKKSIHEQLQRQFTERTVTKRYEALLNGILPIGEGTISLPLRVDLDDRPRQLVCFEHGKSAVTKYKVIEVDNGLSRIHFWPITGRTHQLRMHASHKDGLNTAIVGDDLYGQKSDRLYLHAAYLSFTHPVSKEKIEIFAQTPF